MTRTGILLTTSAATVGIALTAFIDVPKKFIWNASASVPLGLYAVITTDYLSVGDRVAIDPLEPLARYLSARGYLPLGVPLLKTIAAVPGQRVCRIGSTIIIDGKAVGEAHDCDQLGRGLPVWQGCRRIGDGNPCIWADQQGRQRQSGKDVLGLIGHGPFPNRPVLPLPSDRRGIEPANPQRVYGILITLRVNDRIETG